MDKVRVLTVQHAQNTESSMQERIKFNVKENLPLTTGDTSKYKKILGIDIDDLQGQMILDVGSGLGGFIDDCNDRGMDAIGMDPQYANVSSRRERDKQTPRSTRNKIAGISETLPFRDKVFDLVSSSYASFYYLFDNYDVKVGRVAAKLMFEEMFRVLKVGGQARIGKECCETEEDIDSLNDILTNISKSNPDLKWSFSNPEIDDHDFLIIRRLG
jgi:ubiquinone/menaquinone biosynthesis C-methylase UbiE